MSAYWVVWALVAAGWLLAGTWVLVSERRNDQEQRREAAQRVADVEAWANSAGADYTAAGTYLDRYRVATTVPKITRTERMMLHAMRVESGLRCPADCPASDHRSAA